MAVQASVLTVILGVASAAPSAPPISNGKIFLLMACDGLRPDSVNGHDTPQLADYRLLLAESEEAAWIATEGSVFNHATDRVADVSVTANTQRALGRPIKDVVEISATGSVRQTAFRADPVVRAFRSEDGLVEMTVPGSFYEFISRDLIERPEGDASLDLRFDSSNAQGIFKMTRAG